MRRLKIFMDQKNYMCIGNTHLFFNFNHANLEYITSINPRSVQTIHIFLTTHAAVNNDLKILIDKYKKFIVDGQEYRSKIVIHLPRQIKELKTLIEKFLGPEYVVDNGYILIAERKGPRFMLDSYPDCCQYIDNWLNVIYDKFSIKLSMTREAGHPDKRVLYGLGAYPMSIKFPEYPYNVIDKENDPGIFETAEMRLEPDMFKDKLIDGFKKNCPEGILKSFKSDEDIWEYIMEQGTWSQKNAPVSSTNKSIRGLVPSELYIDDHWDNKDRVGLKVESIKNLSEIEVPDGMKIAIVGHGHQPLSEKLHELIKEGKVVIMDEMSEYTPALAGIGGMKLPEPVMFPEMEYLGAPRNREERRASKKGGRKR